MRGQLNFQSFTGHLVRIYILPAFMARFALLGDNDSKCKGQSDF